MAHHRCASRPRQKGRGQKSTSARLQRWSVPEQCSRTVLSVRCRSRFEVRLPFQLAFVLRDFQLTSRWGWQPTFACPSTSGQNITHRMPHSTSTPQCRQKLFHGRVEQWPSFGTSSLTLHFAETEVFRAQRRPTGHREREAGTPTPAKSSLVLKRKTARERASALKIHVYAFGTMG